MSEKLIYLASPYSDPDWKVERARFYAVCDAAVKMVAAGLRVYSPIAHTHPIAERAGLRGIALPKGYEFWREFDERMIAACDELWILMLDDWDDSAGVRREVEFARSIDKTVCVIEPDDPTVWSATAFLLEPDPDWADE